jgi:alanine racemase
MSEPPLTAAATMVALQLTPVVYTVAGVEAIAKAVVECDAVRPYPLHLKVDTGMHRVGVAPGDALELARAIAQHDEVELEGVCTHFAVADEPDAPFTVEQLTRFEAVLGELQHAGHAPRVVHAANTAAGLAYPAARFDLIRAGIGIYGISPAEHLASHVSLQPVLSLTARVSFVKRCQAGDRISYGQRYVCATDTLIATVPIGYADGVPRALGAVAGEVLVGGMRRPIAGTITMDQLMVDCGAGPVMVGDEVVLLGRQGVEEITATEWADRLGTIPYEIVCGLGSRVPRHVRG